MSVRSVYIGTDRQTSDLIGECRFIWLDNELTICFQLNVLLKLNVLLAVSLPSECTAGVESTAGSEFDIHILSYLKISK